MNLRVTDTLRASVTAALMGGSCAAFGAGFYLSEVGTPGSLGTAGVANPTNTFTADASWTNPAGMTGVDQEHFLTGAQLIVPSIKFHSKDATNTAGPGRVQGDDGGNAGVVAPVPSFFYIRPLSDRARFGFSLTGPLGGGLDYGSDFVGRYAIRDVTLIGVGFTPSLAYRVTDKLSVGAGVSAIYTRLDQSIAVRQGAPDPSTDGRVKFEGLDDWAFQGILSLTYEFSDRLLFGAVYRSEADVNLKGDLDFRGVEAPLPDSTTKISWTNPQWLEVGLRYQVTDATTLFFNGGWQEWSKFSNNELSFENNKVKTLDRNWDDTWHAGVAIGHKLSERSGVSLGLSYDSSPVKDKYRTLDFPLDETWKLSGSYAWNHKDNISFALGATIYFIGDAPVEQSAQGVTVRGDYDSNMFAIVGGTLRYDF